MCKDKVNRTPLNKTKPTHKRLCKVIVYCKPTHKMRKDIFNIKHTIHFMCKVTVYCKILFKLCKVSYILCDGILVTYQ